MYTAPIYFLMKCPTSWLITVLRFKCSGPITPIWSFTPAPHVHKHRFYSNQLSRSVIQLLHQQGQLPRQHGDKTMWPAIVGDVHSVPCRGSTIGLVTRLPFFAHHNIPHPEDAIMSDYCRLFYCSRGPPQNVLFSWVLLCLGWIWSTGASDAESATGGGHVITRPPTHWSPDLLYMLPLWWPWNRIVYISTNGLRAFPEIIQSETEQFLNILQIFKTSSLL